MPSKTKAKEFVKKWANRGDEKQDTSHFWLELLQEVYGDQDVHNDTHISFEVRADKQNKAGKDYKDVVINRRSNNATLIEQKSYDIALDHKGKQSNGELLTPFEQAKKYDNNSAVDDKARWIITCNFQEFWIYDMKKTGTELYSPKVIKLEELPSKIEWLDFLLPNYSEDNPQFIEETQVSFKAGELVGKMYDALLERYADPTSEHTQKELNKLCVRLVFCMYADDAGLFDKNDTNKFENYLKNTEVKYLRRALKDLFEILDQKAEERDPYLDESLKEFPYVNGGLFAGEVEIPNFDDKLKELLVVEECAKFDWSVVSPTIFGAVFESTLNSETRRNGGMHYTSIENIHKVIDPLFLDGLKKELNDALSYSISSRRESSLREFQEKISNLTFMDPACGSGNFLTETYLSLRRLENEVIRQLQGIKVALNFEDNSVIKVSIQQFFGIEINDFAVAVAKTALWIAESQMFKETESILSGNREYFPLHSYNNILEGNALQIEWNDVIDASKLDYIMGNPPFVGSSRTDSKNDQKKDMQNIVSDIKGAGKLDYVAGWYFKSAKYINDKIRCAFVSTNSISQGEQVSLLWKPLFEKYDIKIDYAYRSFKWYNQASNTASVVCVIVGFSKKELVTKRFLYDKNTAIEVKHINGYLCDCDDFYILSRTKPLDDSHGKLIQGNKPWDGGFLILNEEEKNYLVNKYPNSSKYILKFYGSRELIKNTPRYCLWLIDVAPNEYNKIPEIMDRISKVAEVRKETKTVAVKQQALTPAIFSQIRQPKERYLAIPEVSTSSRQYIPMEFLNPTDISSNKLFMLPGATNYDFGILESRVHMSWMRMVAGRLGTGYSYSPSVYSNFIWPTPTNEQKEKIERTAQAILDARALSSDSTLADLYDPLTMPLELRKAHEENDKEVMKAYGFDKDMTEPEIVAELFKRYECLVKQAEK